MTEIRIATRRSALALAQARSVAERLGAAHPGLRVTLVEVETSGDRDQISPVSDLTETGAFVRSVQQAVAADRADLAVHSLKDLPVSDPPGLVIAAYPERAAANDVMVGSSLDALPVGATVGTGSPRRAAQLAALRPDLLTAELRGNVDSRLRKIDEGQVDAAVLAEAGLHRLGRDDAVSERLPIETMVPAPGQGALAVEARAGSEAAELAGAIDDRRLRPLLMAERSLLARTGAGCRSSLGAVAVWNGDSMRMLAFVDDGTGPRRSVVEESDPESVVSATCEELGL